MKLVEKLASTADLVSHFLHHFGRRMNKTVSMSSATLQALKSYHWPGNVRELENIIERAMIVSTGDTLEFDARWLRSAQPERATQETRPGLVEVERRTILDALERCHGKIYGPGGAAAVLGLKPTTLYGKMRKYQIPKHPAGG